MALKPVISGTRAGQRSTDEAPIEPFSNVTIADPNGKQNRLTIALAGRDGTLTGNGLIAEDDGTYTLAGGAAKVTASLQALVFTPAAGEPGSQADTRFTLTDRSAAAPNASAMDAATTVVDSDTPAAPAAPRLTAAADTGISSNDGVTGDATPSVTGTASPGAIVTVYSGDTVVGRGTAAGTGAYRIAVSGLSEGVNAISATQAAHGLSSARGPTRKVTIDTEAPTIAASKVSGPGVSANGGGRLGPGKTVTFTLSTTEPVFVDGGTPLLSLNDGGTASYTGGSGTKRLTFSYTVAPGENTDALAATGLSAGGAAVTDRAGNPLDLASLASADTPAGRLAIDTQAPAIAAVAVRGPGVNANGGGRLGPGKTVTFSLSTTEPVFVDGGTPLLSLDDGGTASYTGGSGTKRLTFSYTVAPGENTDALAATGLSAGGAAVTDRAGNPLDLASLTSADTPAGQLVIDTEAPTVALADAGGATGNPAVRLTGTVAGADAMTRVAAFDGGSARAAATAKVKLDGSFSLPVRLQAGANAFSVFATDRVGNVSPPATATYTSVPDSVSLDQVVTYDDGVFTLTGEASSVSGIDRVEIYASVAGKVKDLGPAVLDTDGTFTFRDAIGANQQGFFQARLVGAAGETTSSADPLFSLTGGLGPYGGGGRETTYIDGGDAEATVGLFRLNGLRSITDVAPGLTVGLQPYDVVFGRRQGDTTFVFTSGDASGAVDVVRGFRLGGSDHDVIALPSTDFAGLADVLRHTGDVNGSAVITDPTTREAVRLANVTTGDLKSHSRDIELT